MAEEEWQTPDWKPAGNEAALEAAIGRDLLLVEIPATGGCGEYEFSVQGPGRRSDVPDFAYCARELKYRARGRNVPDFMISGVRVGSTIGGPSNWVFEDVLLRYEKGKWVETVIMAIDYGGGKPASDQ